MRDRTIKSVNFSSRDEFEMKMLDHAARFGSFSTYVKRLIQRDMEGGEQTKIPASSDRDLSIDTSFVSSVI